MSDIRNAAVLLMTLPEDAAGDLMSKLDPKQVEQVSIEIARTRIVCGRRARTRHQGIRRGQPLDGRPRRRPRAGEDR